MARVPAAAPTRMAPAEADAVRAAVDGVLRDGPWILGPAVEAFEADWSAYTGHPHVLGVGNGTDALALALTALGLSPGAGVLVAANEGGYAATAARMVGLVPRVVDVDAVTWGPTPELLAAADHPAVEAAVITHLHGDAVPLDEIDAWRRRRGLALVEDCAQAHGLRPSGGSHGAHVGTVGDAATYSFYPTKNLGAVGDAGAVCLADPAAAAQARTLRQYGWGDRFRVELAGGRNSRLDPLQAAVLSARLPFLDARNQRRRSIAGHVRAALPAGVELHGDPATTVAHHAVAVGERRDDLAAHLERAGVDTGVHYPYLLGDMPGLGLEPTATPVAAHLRDRILSLPCFPELTDAEVDRVCDALGEFAAVLS